jgi:hypothetical protein
MTSPSRRPSRPIESITIKVSIEGSADELRSLRQKLAGSRVSNGVLRASIETTDPEAALQALKGIGDVVRAAEKSPKGFK